ncbi:MAG TPA: alpha/beta hydrolase [Acetobacteraceae bacterium]|jgi:pimeloyl-ACP methyl ester carboxylesterase
MPSVRSATLEIAYQEFGPPDGAPVVLLHGFPDDVHAYADMASPLAAAGCRVLVPWLRGYGGTRFLDPATPRSGQQAALGADLRDFMDALGIERAALAGYDWGGRAACVVAALWPERVRCLVSVGGYNIQDIAQAAAVPASAEQERRMWYVWYFNTERGRAGLAANRREIARLLWRLWSPNWRFSEAGFERTASSFDNPDFVDVVIHSYRHRILAAPGDPALEQMEQALAEKPAISVPTIVLHGAADGVSPAPTPEQDARFTGPYGRRTIPVAGHFLPNEAPGVLLEAITDLLGRT